MTSDTSFDVIVIGAGGMGSAAFYHLASAGYRVLLLEQFELDHNFGSSYGYSRIIRYAYDHPDYIALANDVFPMWESLQSEANEELMIITGGLDIGHPNEKRFAETRQAMLDMEIPFEELSAQTARQRFPQIHFPDDVQVLYQAKTGLLKPSRCVRAHVRLGEHKGGILRDQTPVQDIQLFADSVTVTTPHGDFSAGSLVIGGGAWSGGLLRSIGLDLPLQPTREQLVFYESPPTFSADNMPVAIFWDEEIYYTIPSVDGHGFKCARHFSGEEINKLETVNRTPDEAYIADTRAHLQRCFPTFAASDVTEARVCLYTVTPDEHFVIDRHPAYPHVAFGAGFSGHGFKFSTLIGKILGEIATGQPVQQNINLFRIDRF